jgi:hypothetical protein
VRSSGTSPGERGVTMEVVEEEDEKQRTEAGKQGKERFKRG